MINPLAAIGPFLTPEWTLVLFTVLGGLGTAAMWVARVESRLNHQAEKEELHQRQHNELKAAVQAVDTKIEDLMSVLFKHYLGKQDN
jgi:hypothetical protein